MISNVVLLSKNTACQLVITVCLSKTEGGKQTEYKRFTGYSSNALLEKVQVSHRDLQRRFGAECYFAVVEKLLILRAMVVACPAPLLGDASVFEATWGQLPFYITDHHLKAVRGKFSEPT